MCHLCWGWLPHQCNALLLALPIELVCRCLLGRRRSQVRLVTAELRLDEQQAERRGAAGRRFLTPRTRRKQFFGIGRPCMAWCMVENEEVRKMSRATFYVWRGPGLREEGAPSPSAGHEVNPYM